MPKATFLFKIIVPVTDCYIANFNRHMSAYACICGAQRIISLLLLITHILSDEFCVCNILFFHFAMGVQVHTF